MFCGLRRTIKMYDALRKKCEEIVGKLNHKGPSSQIHIIRSCTHLINTVKIMRLCYTQEFFIGELDIFIYNYLAKDILKYVKYERMKNNP